ncbi:Inactive LRR receptor-like serine/threonine-protein kinase BIR2 [Vitis vinifera]|uniref:Inactive LRR receptor-like serine/threonine-protein kinase BIR2 n=1 Tax=Vitis vinifera TaxID=29760 RepID=A0A438KPS6_VITVI|nr:Inactive LRR receptor-like serine/threonine-protein kinase BIR2 [Vitis vinifera]
MYKNEKIYGREEFDQITGRNEIELVRDRCKKRGKWNADERAEVMGKDKGHLPTPLFHAPPPTRVYAFVFTEPPLAPQLSASCCLSLPTTISSSSYISLTCANFSRIKRGEARSKEDRTTPPPLPKLSFTVLGLEVKNGCLGCGASVLANMRQSAVVVWLHLIPTGRHLQQWRIYKLSLTNLSLRGSISPYLSNCTNLQSLDLSSNSLTGPIPSDLQSLVNLAVLNLSSNHLDGEIPPQLAFCAYLNVIDLHDNSLSGPIPQQFGLLVRLSAFDVSNNRLSGPIPPNLGNRSGNFPRFNASSFEGNKDLYGYPLAPLKSRGLSILAIVGIGLGSGFVSLVLSFTAVCIWLRVTEEKMASEEGKISQLMPDY